MLMMGVAAGHERLVAGSEEFVSFAEIKERERVTRGEKILRRRKLRIAVVQCFGGVNNGELDARLNVVISLSKVSGCANWHVLQSHILPCDCAIAARSTRVVECRDGVSRGARARKLLEWSSLRWCQ